MSSIRLIKYDSLATIRSDIEADAKQLPATTIAGTTHTVTAADLGKLLRFTSASAVTVTLPQASTEDLPDGFFVVIQQAGTGAVILATEGADVLETLGGADRTSGQYAQATIQKITDGTWAAGGALE